MAKAIKGRSQMRLGEMDKLIVTAAVTDKTVFKKGEFI